MFDSSGPSRPRPSPDRMIPEELSDEVLAMVACDEARDSIAEAFGRDRITGIAREVRSCIQAGTLPLDQHDDISYAAIVEDLEKRS